MLPGLVARALPGGAQALDAAVGAFVQDHAGDPLAAYRRRSARAAADRGRQDRARRP